MSQVPVLTTARLVLRPFADDDAEALYPTMADADLMTWWSRGPLASVEETLDYLEPRVGSEAWRRWTMTLAGDDRAIGMISSGEKRQGGVSEIGYLLARDCWGRGLAREGVAAVIDWLFAQGQRRVFADTDPENTASIALLERLGFQREGRLRGEWETHIGVRDSLILGLLKGEWQRHSPPLQEGEITSLSVPARGSSTPEK